MPFRDYSSFFPTNELDAFTAAFDEAWKHLCDARATPDQVAVLKGNLAESFWHRPAKMNETWNS